jgi:hypothetical protein
LRRTVKYASGPSPSGCPARDASACAARGTTIFAVSRHHFMKHPGQGSFHEPAAMAGPVLSASNSETLLYSAGSLI